MNGFEQIKSFYSWVFNNQEKVRSSHISLYMFLLNQNNRSMWVEWFKCPYDLAMQGACIGNKNTYYKALSELQDYGLIEHKKGVNGFKAPLIKLIQLYDNDTSTAYASVPQSEPQAVPLTEPLTVLLNKNTYKLITDNYKLVNNNIEGWINKPPTAKFSFFNSLIDLGISKQIANDFLANRKTKKLTNTETAFKQLLNEIEKSNKTPIEIITICAENGWGSFKNSWNINKQNNLQDEQRSEQIERARRARQI